MRPIVSEQDPLRHPLNVLLGTQAQVRLLRVMANEVDSPVSDPDVARRAGLTVPGAQKALGKVIASGFISRVGGGRKHLYEIRSSDRLMQAKAVEQDTSLLRRAKDHIDRLLKEDQGTANRDLEELEEPE